MYQGWRVVAAAFAVMFLSYGCAYSFTAFFPELQRESVPRTQRYRLSFRSLDFSILASVPGAACSLTGWVRAG